MRIEDTMGFDKVAGKYTGARPSDHRQYQVTRIQDWHREVMRLIVLGWTSRAIAVHLKCSEAAVAAIKNSELTRRQINVMHAARDRAMMNVDEKLVDSSGRAADVLHDMLDDPMVSPAVRKSVATAILDRSGNGPTQKIEGRFISGKFNLDDLEELRKRREAATQQGLIIEKEIPLEEVKI